MKSSMRTSVSVMIYISISRERSLSLDLFPVIVLMDGRRNRVQIPMKEPQAFCGVDPHPGPSTPYSEMQPTINHKKNIYLNVTAYFSKKVLLSERKRHTARRVASPGGYLPWPRGSPLAGGT